MEPVKRENEIMETSWSISPEKYFDTKFEYQERFFNEKFLGIQIQNKAEHLILDKKIDVLAEQNKAEHLILDKKIDVLAEQNKAEHISLDRKIDALAEQNKTEHLILDKKIDALAEQNKFEHTGLERRIDRNFQISMTVQGLIVAILGLLVTLHFVH